MLGQSKVGAELTHLDQYSLSIFCPKCFAQIISNLNKIGTLFFVNVNHKID